MRRPIFAANWKMQKTAGEAEAFADKLLPLVAGADRVDIVIAPPFTALDRLGHKLDGSNVTLAAQNVNAEERGAFTGEIAPGMLVDLGCRYTLVGHSERRALYGENDEQVARKAAALLAHGIRPIVCVGESLEQRKRGDALDVVRGQLSDSLATVEASQADDIVIAYEPVWAIGTGETATPEIAQEVHGHIREQLRVKFGEAGDRIRIQYGGSVKPENVDELMTQSDIDGALVGGASLDPEAFSRIVRFEKT
jgi:triosephosphate isomerase